MLVSAPDGRGIKVERRWLPWRLRKRQFDDVTGDPFMFLDGADDPAGAAVGCVLGIVFFLFGGLILTIAVFASEALLLLLLLVPLVAAGRMFWVLPWIIEARNGDALLGTEMVRGWRDSGQRIREIAEAYQRGQDPFLGTRIP
ncbi:MAG: hypothetical protein ACJ72L_17270 [Marmoricola sp.]